MKSFTSTLYTAFILVSALSAFASAGSLTGEIGQQLGDRNGRTPASLDTEEEVLKAEQNSVGSPTGTTENTGNETGTTTENTRSRFSGAHSF